MIQRRCPEGGYCRFSPDAADGNRVSCEKCGTLEGPPAGFELVFERVERAIDANPKLARLRGLGGEPQIFASRLVTSIRIPVQRRGAEAMVMSGTGLTLNEAVDNLLFKLDAWAGSSSPPS